LGPALRPRGVENLVAAVFLVAIAMVAAFVAATTIYSYTSRAGSGSSASITWARAVSVGGSALLIEADVYSSTLATISSVNIYYSGGYMQCAYQAVVQANSVVRVSLLIPTAPGTGTGASCLITSAGGGGYPPSTPGQEIVVSVSMCMANQICSSPSAKVVITL